MKKNRYILKNICWIAVLILGIAGIVYGCADQYARSEWETVLSKATNICFQCIGLG